MRLLDSLNVSKHFIRPLNSLFPSPGLRHVAYARPLGGIMLLMRPRGPAPGAADAPDARPWGSRAGPADAHDARPLGASVATQKTTKKKPFTGGTRGSAALASERLFPGRPGLKGPHLLGTLGTSRCPILRGCAHGRAAHAEARGEQFLSMLGPLNSLKISKR